MLSVEKLYLFKSEEFANSGQHIIHINNNFGEGDVMYEIKTSAVNSNAKPNHGVIKRDQNKVITFFRFPDGITNDDDYFLIQIAKAPAEITEDSDIPLICKAMAKLRKRLVD